MTSTHGRGLLHLAAAVDRQGLFDADLYVESARLAERGGLDFVTLGDSFRAPAPTRSGCSRGSRPPPRGSVLCPP